MLSFARLCFMKQQPDPNHHFRPRWALPYTHDVRCTCTHILLQMQLQKCTGRYHISMPKAKDYFYTDEPMLFVDEENQDNLRVLLGCDTNTSSMIEVSTRTETTVRSTTSSTRSEAPTGIRTSSINRISTNISVSGTKFHPGQLHQV